MSQIRFPVALVFAAFTFVTVSAACAADDPDAVLVARGEYTLTLGDMDARMSRFPEHERAQFARDPANLARLMDRLLYDSMLADEARQMGLENDPAVRRDLELAVREVLAIHRMNRLFDQGELPDFRLLARERYLADPTKHVVPEKLVIEHVLISTRERSDEEALALAGQVRMLAAKNPTHFPELVAEYSEDPSKSSNNGRFDIDDPEKFVAEFVDAARNLDQPDEISAPVKTDYGYHILRLIEKTPARQRSYEEVEDALLRSVELDYRDTARSDYRTTVRARHQENGNEALLLTLPARYGGRPEEASASD